MKKLMMIAMIGLLAVVCGVIPSFGATYTNYVGGLAFTAEQAPVRAYATTVDFATKPLASNDVLQVILVPSNTVVSFVEYEVLTTNTPCVTPADTSIVYIGDDGDTDRWKADASMAAKGATLGTATPYLYSADNTIDITAKAALTNGTIRIRAFMVNCGR